MLATGADPMQLRPSRSGRAGRILAVIVLFALLAGLFYAYRSYGQDASEQERRQNELQAQLDDLKNRPPVTNLDVENINSEGAQFKNLSVTERTSLHGTLSVDGDSTFMGDINHAGNLTSSGSITAARFNGSFIGSAQGDFSGSFSGNHSGSYAGDGSGLTDVDAATLNSQSGAFYQNAANLNAGTLSDARLSSNVALRDADNLFTGKNRFTQPVAGVDAINTDEMVTLGQLTEVSAGNYFLQGGNSYDATAVIGTNDAHDLSIRTDGTERLRIDTGGDLTVMGNTALSGTLGVAGSTNLAALNTSGAASLNSLIVVNASDLQGNTTIGGSLGVSGSTTLAGLSAGATTLNSLGVTNNATIGGALGVTGATTLSGGLTSSGNTTVSGPLTVSGNSTFSGTTTFNNNVSVVGANPFSVGTGASTLGGSLNVSGAAAFGSTLSVSGLSTFSLLGVADTATALCRNTSGQLAACNTTGTGAAFVQGGNSFGAIATLGTNDAFDLQLETGGTTRLTIQNSTGNVGIGNTGPGAKLQVNTEAAGTVGQIIQGAASQTADLLQLQNSSGSVLTRVDSAGNFIQTNGWSTNTNDPNLSGTGNLTFAGSNAAIQGSSTLRFYVGTGGTISARVYSGQTGRPLWDYDGDDFRSSGTPPRWMAAGPAFTLTDSTGAITGGVIAPARSENVNLPPWFLGTTTTYATSSNDILRVHNGPFAAVAPGGSQFAVAAGGTVSIRLQDVASVGLVVKGKASQTGDLLQLQNSSGNVLTKITSGGILRAVNQSLQVARSDQGANLDSATLFATLNYSSNGSVGFVNQAGVPLPVSATSVQSFSGGLSYRLQLNSNSLGIYTANAQRQSWTTTTQINSIADTDIALTVKGVASQTGDLLQAQDSTGAVLARIDAAGNLTVKNATVQGALSVTGAVSLSSTLTVAGNATFSGNVISFSNNVRGIDQAITTGATTLAVTFGTAYPDAAYAVTCTANYNTTCFVTGKTTTGFTLNFGTAAPASAAVDWFVAH